MDPMSGLAIASSCMSLATKSGTLILRITIFVSEVRNARRDLDAVSRELTSLQLCLSALKDEQQFGSLNLPEDMKNHINQILVNIDLILNQISDMLIKVSSGKLGRRIQWVTTHKEEMNKFRCSLESNKSALEIALTLGSISMLAQQAQSMVKQDGQVELLVQRTESISISTKIIDGKIDALKSMHQADTRLDSITQEITFLRTQMADLANNTSNATLNAFRKESEAYTQSLLRPIASALSDTNTIAITRADPQRSSDFAEGQLCSLCAFESGQSFTFCEKHQGVEELEMYYKQQLDTAYRENMRLQQNLKRSADDHQQNLAELAYDHISKEKDYQQRLTKSANDLASMNNYFRQKLDKIYGEKLQSEAYYQRMLKDLERGQDTRLREETERLQKAISDLEAKLEERSNEVKDLKIRYGDLQQLRGEEKVQIRPLPERYQSQKRPLNVLEDQRTWWFQNFPGRSLESAGIDSLSYGRHLNDDLRELVVFNQLLRAEYQKSITVGTLGKARNIPLARLEPYQIKQTDTSKMEGAYSFTVEYCFIIHDQDAQFVKWNQNIMNVAKSFAGKKFPIMVTVGQVQQYIRQQLKSIDCGTLFTNADALFMQHGGGRLNSEWPLHKVLNWANRTTGRDLESLYLMLQPLDQHLSSISNGSGLSLPPKIFVISRSDTILGMFSGQGSSYGAYVYEGSSRRSLFTPKGSLRNSPWPIARISDPE